MFHRDLHYLPKICLKMFITQGLASLLTDGNSNAKGMKQAQTRSGAADLFQRTNTKFKST